MMSAADLILASCSLRVPRRRLDTAITVLMLLPSGPDVRLGHDGIRKRRYRLDSALLLALLKASRETETQRAIVGSPAFMHLPDRLFRRLFLRFWARHRSNPWRWTLGWALHAFLQDRPREARLYARHIWTMASAPDEAVALAGLASTKFLGGALTLAQVQKLIALTHHQPDRASAATSNLGTLYKDIASLRPEVRALLLDSRTMATIRGANPPDGRSEWSCYHWCLTNMHKALARTRKRPVVR